LKIIVVGGGMKAYFLAKNLISMGYSVTLINKDKEDALQLAKIDRATVVHGDATLPEILEDAGTHTANVVVALTSSDPDNLVVCQTAARLFGVGKTVAIVNDPGNVEVFRTLGIDYVVSTVRTISSLIQQSVGNETIMNLTPVEEGKVMILEVDVNTEDPISGKQLNLFEMPHEAIIGCIIRGGQPIIPRGDTTVSPGDRLIILSLPQVQSATLSAIKRKVD
jgi:trk system potassium uptake protein TrkA